MATNVLSRSVLAAVAGGTGYAARVGAALALGWVAAAGVAGLGGAQSL
jgi:hypothetical protein